MGSNLHLFFFGFLRAGELTVPSESAFDPKVHLCFSDVLVDCIHNPQLVKLKLKASKTDPFRKGVDVILGRTYTDMCPITALLAYLALRGNTQVACSILLMVVYAYISLGWSSLFDEGFGSPIDLHTVIIMYSSTIIILFGHWCLEGAQGVRQFYTSPRDRRGVNNCL